jgi:oligogalacturonide lyase
MFQRTWPAEEQRLHDPLSGRRVRQLTTIGNNVHLYFTDNAFALNGETITFLSDRASHERRGPHEQPHYNVFQLELASGAITQLSDEAAPIVHATKTPDGRLLAYVVGTQVRLLDMHRATTTTIYEERDGYTLGRPSISADGRLVGFARNEPSAAHGPNYAGFAERYYTIKDGRITVARTDGTGAWDVWRDTCQLAHVQWSPDDPTIALFCHEGPWHLVKQRMWGLDVVQRTVWPLFRQAAQDSVGHEFWTMNGLIFFDNRGPGHDGTITSARTQAVASHIHPRDYHEFVPYIGLLDRRGTLLRQIALPFACNHYHANPDNTLLVGDDVDQIVLIDIAHEQAHLAPLCRHATSWHTQASHCHPTWSWQGDKILFASDESGCVQLYLIELD